MIKLHEYKDGTIYQKAYFIEFFDIGGNSAHKLSTKIFFAGTDGKFIFFSGNFWKSVGTIWGYPGMDLPESCEKFTELLYFKNKF